jgi:hypothetical protein
MRTLNYFHRAIAEEKKMIVRERRRRAHVESEE